MAIENQDFDQPVIDAQKISVEVSQNSPLIFSVLRQYKEVVFWERAEIPTVNPSDVDPYMTLAVMDRVDNIAAKAYQDPDLWWLPCYANNVGLPPLKMQPGDKFRLPAPAVVRAVLRGK